VPQGFARQDVCEGSRNRIDVGHMGQSARSRSRRRWSWWTWTRVVRSGLKPAPTRRSVPCTHPRTC